MYSPDPASRFDSPFLAPEFSDKPPSPVDQVKDLASLHGKKIVIGLVVLGVLFFAADFLFLSYKPVTFVVQNAEGEGLTSTIAIYAAGASDPVKSGTGRSLEASLKNGDYRLDVTSSGYESFSNTLTVGESSEYVIKLEKPLKTVFKSVDVPSQFFREVSTPASVVLTNKGSKNEVVELVFSGSLEDVVLMQNPQIQVPSGQDVTVDFSVLFPESFKIKDAKQGDSLKGEIRIKYTSLKKKSVDFTLRPAPSLNIVFQQSKREVNSGQSLQEIGKITFENKSQFSVPPFGIEVSLEDPAFNEWFSFSKTESVELQPRQKDEILVYISPPVLAQALKFAGASKITVESPVFSKEFPLQLDIKKTIAQLDFLTPKAVSITRINEDQYSVNLAETVRLSNKGSTPINNVSVSILQSDCKSRGWLNLSTNGDFDSIDPRETKSIGLRISAPLTAQNLDYKTCSLQVQYDNPITGELEIQQSDVVVNVSCSSRYCP